MVHDASKLLAERHGAGAQPTYRTEPAAAAPPRGPFCDAAEAIAGRAADAARRTADQVGAVVVRWALTGVGVGGGAESLGRSAASADDSRDVRCFAAWPARSARRWLRLASSDERALLGRLERAFEQWRAALLDQTRTAVQAGSRCVAGRWVPALARMRRALSAAARAGRTTRGARQQVIVTALGALGQGGGRPGRGGGDQWAAKGAAAHAEAGATGRAFALVRGRCRADGPRFAEILGRVDGACDSWRRSVEATFARYEAIAMRTLADAADPERVRQG